MLTEWQRVYMHDNRREVESCTEESDGLLDRLVADLDRYTIVDDNTSKYRARIIERIKEINKQLRDNLDKFEDAIMRANHMHDEPDPEYSYTPDDYMRESVEEAE